MRIGVLTSSRADYSIYFPLLKALQNNTKISLEIIAFGTHLSSRHGNTVQKITEDGFSVRFRVKTISDDDTPQAISESMGKTVMSFAKFWNDEKFDLVFCVGDRYEMFAACASSVPFNMKLAHIHGGEKTLGAIDEVFRHSITHMAAYHFTAAELYKQRVVQLRDNPEHVYNVGSLSIDNLKSLDLLSVDEFKKRFNIDLGIPSILITFHPETVSVEKNEFFIDQLIQALDLITGYQYILTMPNADPMGNMIRKTITEFASRTPHAKVVESFGTVGYLSCMKHCSFMLGNTSSGFIEASYFPKFVINLGDRQKGRIVTGNIYNCPVETQQIVRGVNLFSDFSQQAPINIYGSGNAATNILKALNLSP